MKAVFAHEIRTYFKTLTAYVFGAFLLAFAGIGVMIYNINASVSNFEYVLEFGSIIFVVIVPILTMKVLAEERRQRTDQLLYALPINTSDVVIGKYLALMVVYTIPIAIIAIYPLIFRKFGEVYLPTSYGTLVAFYLMGAALIAMGEFISSLTENQGFAAGISIAAILLNYVSVSLSEFVSATAYSSLIAVCLLAVLIACIVDYVTKSTYLAIGVGGAIAIAAGVIYFVNDKLLEGLLPAIMNKISLFKQLSVFVSGVFDVSAIVYFISVIVIFLFLTVQSLEKRRYN